MTKKFIVSVIFLFCLSSNAQQTSWKDLTESAFKLYQQGKYEKAVKITKEALRIAKQEFGPDSLQIAESIGNLGALYDFLCDDAKCQKAENLLARARSIRNKHGIHGVPLGLQTEAFFDKVAKLKTMQKIKGKQGSSGITLSGSVLSFSCDLDMDSDCDDGDFKLFKESLNKCESDFYYAYEFQADPDGDGCITDKDEKILFPNAN